MNSLFLTLRSPHLTPNHRSSPSPQDLDAAIGTFLERRPTPSTSNEGRQRLDEGYFVVTAELRQRLEEKHRATSAQDGGAGCGRAASARCGACFGDLRYVHLLWTLAMDDSSYG